MHLFIKYSILHHFWPKVRPRFRDIFSISGNALMNHFFSIVLSCEKAKNGSVRLCGSDAPFHQTIFQFFIRYYPEMRLWITSSIVLCEKEKNGSMRLCPDFGQMLRYFLNFRKCPYESLLQHRNILRKSEIRLGEVLRIRCTFSSNIQFFIIFGPNLGPDLRYFLNFRKCPNESLLQHRVILRKSKKRFCEVMRIRCTFSSKLQFFIIIGLILDPDFEIFSQFQEMRLWTLFFSIVISCEKAKYECLRFCGSNAPFHQIFNFSWLYGLNLGPPPPPPPPNFEIFSQFQEMPL